MEFSGLLRQMDAYRATVSQLVARESGYNSIIRNLDQKLQDMDVQLERLQQNTHFKVRCSLLDSVSISILK